MMELPSTAWRDVPWTFEEALAFAPCDARWIALPGQVRHTFTHFHLRLSVLSGQTAATDPGDGLWWPMTRLAEQPLPTVMRKVVALAGGSAGPGYSS
jgi:A/G-specific adenine glycosylase